MYKKLLSVCSNDIRQCKREFNWMVEELQSRSKSISKSNTLNPSKTLTPKDRVKLAYWVDQRSKNKPLQYILGSQPFLSMPIIVRPPILIPRWETEEMCSNLIEDCPPSPIRILDLCCGSGCISLAFAKHLPNASIDGLDISSAAIKLSKLNQRRLQIEYPRLQFYQADIMSDDILNFKHYDIVISNPPYITPVEYEGLDASVSDWESSIALVTKDKLGLEFYERISSLHHLFKPGARLVVEIGNRQGEHVRGIFVANGFKNVVVCQDLAGLDRVVSAYYPN